MDFWQIFEEIDSIFCLWASLAFQETHHAQQETRHVHDSINWPKNEFSFVYLNILNYQPSIDLKFYLIWLFFQTFWIKLDITAEILNSHA